MADMRELREIAEQLGSELLEKENSGNEHPSHLAADLLEGVSERIGGFGVEGVIDEEKDIDLMYVNTGDPYSPTVIYDGSANKFLAAAWGGIVEEKEREYERLKDMERLESIADRLNKEWADTKSLPDEERESSDSYAALELLKGVNSEIEGEGVSGAGGNGLDFFFVDVGDPDRPTILFDGHEGKFLAGSRNDIFESQKQAQGKEDAEISGLERIAERLNVEFSERKKGYRDHISHLVAEMLKEVSDEIGGFGAEGTLDEERGIDIQYINMGDAYNLTILFDSTKNEFLATTWADVMEEKEREYERRAEREPEEPELEREGDEKNRDVDTASFLAAVKSGDSVYIGERQYYIHSANRFHANLYAMDELDALPDEMTLFEDHPPYKKEELLKDPYGLTLGVRKNALPVTDYFMDIEAFRDTVVSNPRNSDIIRDMGLKVPERENPIIPVPQTNASPYYAVGDTVYLKGDAKVRIHAIGNINVWCSTESGELGEIQRIGLRDLNRDFFENRRNEEAVERGRAIEESGEKQTVSSVNLPALAERLNEERKDIRAWEAAHPDKTIQEWLDEISKDIKCESFGPLGEPPKGTDLWRINLKGRDESLFYDYIEQKFLYGKTSDVYRTKEAEHEQYLERLESLAGRLNGRISDFRESDAPDMRHYVTDLLADANREMRGDGVSISSDEERGVYVRYVDKHGNPYIPTILYDGHEEKFLAGSLHDLERKQIGEHERLQSEKEELANFKDIAARHNARIAESEGMSDEDRDMIAYRLLSESIASIGGDNLSVIYQKDRGPVIDYVDIDERRPFTLVYDRESKHFLVGDPHALLKEKENEIGERENSTRELSTNTEKSYDLGYGHLGNGLTVWNHLEERDGDYVTVAHIAPDRAVSFRDENLPESVKEQILDIARTSDARISATQDAPVFDTPPIEENQELDGPAPEPGNGSTPQSSETELPLDDSAKSPTPEPQTQAKSILGELDWPKPRNKTEEYRQEFTKKIISLMEQGEAFWQQPWKSPDTCLPYNAKTGNRYNGVNIAYLMVSSIKQGFSDPRWMTYKQAQEEGYQVKQGEHGTRIEFYTEYDPSKTKKGSEAIDRRIQEMMASGLSRDEIDKALEDQKILIVKTYTVFNASQIEGIEPLETNISGSEKEFRYHERAESIMDNCGVPIRYGMPGAAYNKSQDIIKMPNREWFKTPEHFYATVLHEIAHSTGHPSRMNRDDLGHPFGSPEYAMEELRAEMASAFVFQEIEMPLSSEDMEGYVKDHAAYTQHWLGKLKEDYKEFYSAVRDATKIADYTLAYEHARDRGNISPATGNTVKPNTAEAAAAIYDPVQAAKDLIGESAIVTNAQRGRTYTGEILRIDDGHAIQRTGPNRGIIHNLGKFGDPAAPSKLSELPDKKAKVSISYDGSLRASLKTASREEERETSVTR
jgi:antirestriction protein ArdC